MNLDELLRTRIDATMKGVPDLAGRNVALADVGRMGWNLLAGDLPAPVATIDDGAMRANSRWMQTFTDSHGVRICPHGKTTMAPQLFQRQLADGAWGITVATVQQLRVCLQFGVRRVLMANQLVGEHDIRSILHAVRDDPTLDFYCLVDSADNIRQLHRLATELDIGRPLQVLIEGGVPGGRTGCRHLDEAVALAELIGTCGPYLALRGVEGFEGVIECKSDSNGAVKVRQFVAFLSSLLLHGMERRLFTGDKPLLSIGGSIYFDLVATHPAVQSVNGKCEVILRSGCYLTHDSGMLTDNFLRVRARTPDLDAPGLAFQPALTVWGMVQSLPEPGLAILNVGKRDISFDVDLPVAERWFRRGLHVVPVAIPESSIATQINDQHLFLKVAPATQYRVGDLVGLGVSHPCTTFDKWRVLYVIDQDFNVTEGILTFF